MGGETEEGLMDGGLAGVSAIKADEKRRPGGCGKSQPFSAGTDSSAVISRLDWGPGG